VGKNILEQIHLQLSFCWFDKRKSVRNVSSVKNVLSCLRTWSNKLHVVWIWSENRSCRELEMQIADAV
jgi:hypothetical protein